MVCNGLGAVTVNERESIVMANAGSDFEGQFYDKVVPTVIETSNLLLIRKEISHSYLTGVPRKPIIPSVQFHSGLPLYLNSAKKSWMKLKK